MVNIGWAKLELLCMIVQVARYASASHLKGYYNIDIINFYISYDSFLAARSFSNVIYVFR